jgi:hypothetical protein
MRYIVGLTRSQETAAISEGPFPMCEKPSRRQRGGMSGTVYRSDNLAVPPAAASRRKRGMEWARRLVAAGLSAIALAAISPLGDGLRELLFPTRAAVSGVVRLGGQPITDGALVLELDGRRVGARTDETGAFLLERVGNGTHELRVSAAGTQAGLVHFVVPRNSPQVTVETLVLRPLVTMGFAIASEVRQPGRVVDRAKLDYDLAMWIDGPADVLRSIRTVSYVLPIPLPATPVTDVPPASGFCYRQTGTLSYPRIVKPKLEVADAMVYLDDGRSFPVSGQDGDVRPSGCTSVEAPTVSVPKPKPAQPQPRATWPSGQAPTPETPDTSTHDPIGPVITSFSIAERPDCTGHTGSRVPAGLAVQAENADRYEITGDGVSRRGPIAGGTGSVTVTVLCDGDTHTYHLTVTGTDSRQAKSSRTVSTARVLVDQPPPTAETGKVKSN